MAGQNIVELGINVTELEAQKTQALTIFRQLFEGLNQYQGKTISPINVTGLTQFNESISKTGTILSDINNKLVLFNEQMTKSGLSAKATAGGTKELTEAEAKLKVEIAAKNKLLIESAKANNELLQSQQLAKKLEKEIEDSRKQRAAEEAKRKKKELKDSEDKAKQDKKDTEAQQKILDDVEKKKEKLEAANTARQKRESKELDAKVVKMDKADKEEAKRLDVLADKYKQLQILLKQQQRVYVDTLMEKGSSAPETRQALSNLSETQTVIDKIDNSMNNAAGKTNKLVTAASSAFGALTKIAYILPGLGIAGIFSLLGDGLVEILNALDLFTNKASKMRDLEMKTNEIYRERMDIFKTLAELRRAIDEYDPNKADGGLRALDTKSNLGIAPDKELEQKIPLYKEKLLATKSDVFILFDEFFKMLDEQASSDGSNLRPADELFDEETITKSLNYQYSLIKKKSEELGENLTEDLFTATARATLKLNLGDFAYSGNVLALQKKVPFGEGTMENFEERKKLAKDEYLLEVEKFAVMKEAAIRYQQSLKTVNDSEATLNKLKYDQRRKEIESFSKDEIRIEQKKNEEILSSLLSSYDQKEKAYNDLAELQKRSNLIDFQSVENDRESTASDITIAYNKMLSDNVILEKETAKKIADLRYEEYTRYIAATAKIAKSRVESEGIVNQRIADNDKNSLDKRLEAQKNYIQSRLDLEKIEFARDYQAKELRAGGEVPRLEREALELDYYAKRSNIVADQEKKIFEIVSTSLAKRLESILDSNRIEADIDKSKWTNELTVMTKAFNEKKISYENYRRSIQEINKKYDVADYGRLISNDEKLLGDLYLAKTRIVDTPLKAQEQVVSIAETGVRQAENLGNEDDVNVAKLKLSNAKGYYNALLNIQTEFGIKIKDAEKLLEDHRNQKAKAEVAEIEEAEKEKLAKKMVYYRLFAKLEQELYNAAKRASDENYQNQVAALREEQRLKDERFNYEKNAIEKSSLDNKNKTALDIQLSARKLESDKEIQAEEKRLRIEKAKFDKALALSQIALSTTVAVMQAMTTPIAGQLLAIEIAAVGAAQLAIAAAVDIPSYEHGTDSHPGGMARFGEAGPEIVKEPYRSPYLVNKETVSFLPKGTEVIPVKEKQIREDVVHDGWEQTRWLGKQIRKANKQVNNNIKVVVSGNQRFESYKIKTIYGG